MSFNFQQQWLTLPLRTYFGRLSRDEIDLKRIQLQLTSVGVSSLLKGIDAMLWKKDVQQASTLCDLCDWSCRFRDVKVYFLSSSQYHPNLSGRRKSDYMWDLSCFSCLLNMHEFD